MALVPTHESLKLARSPEHLNVDLPSPTLGAAESNVGEPPHESVLAD